MIQSNRQTRARDPHSTRGESECEENSNYPPPTPQPAPFIFPERNCNCTWDAENEPPLKPLSCMAKKGGVETAKRGSCAAAAAASRVYFSLDHSLGAAQAVAQWARWKTRKTS